MQSCGTMGRADERGVSWRVDAPARLHFGFVDLNGDLGRRFGSLGLALECPSLELLVSPSSGLDIIAAESDRLARYVAAAADLFGVPARGRFEVAASIPAHAGLGSGTQLALSVAAGLAQLNGVAFDPVRAAGALDRGNRSGIGLAAFRQGGLVLDGGRAGDDAPPPVIARLPFPPAWAIILVLDASMAGMHGPAEAGSFAALPEFSRAEAAELCRLTLMRILPGAATGDIAAFGAGITALQQRIGDHFAPAQGGRFSSPRVAAALAELAALGAAGVGQSSWGPTGYAFAASPEEARGMVSRLSPRLADAKELTFLVTGGRNRGAAIQALAASVDHTPRADPNRGVAAP